MSSFHSLQVSAVNSVTEDSVVVSFEIPASLESDYQFIAGQYISLEAEIDGALLRRSYSLCSTPDQKNLSVGIKEVPNGIFSTYANNTLAVGDLLNVSTPQGRFVYDSEKENSPVFSIAAGSGITPIFSILNSFLSKKSSQSFTLIYGNKTPEQTMFYQELKALEQEFANQLKIHWVFSQSNEEGSLFGRIDASVIKFVLNQQNWGPVYRSHLKISPRGTAGQAELLQTGAHGLSFHFMQTTSLCSLLAHSQKTNR